MIQQDVGRLDISMNYGLQHACMKIIQPTCCVDANLQPLLPWETITIMITIKAIIKAQFTLTTAAIQASVMEKWGYEISNKKALDGKHKTLRQLFGDFSQSYIELSRLFLAIEQANLRCVVIWKTFDINMPNIKIFQRLFWSFKPSIGGFKHCRPRTEY